MHLAGSVLILNNLLSCPRISTPLFIYNQPRLSPLFLNTSISEQTRVKVSTGADIKKANYQLPSSLLLGIINMAFISNLTLIYSRLTAGKVINLSSDHFRRGNYNTQEQQPQMNNSYCDKMVHQLHLQHRRCR